MQHGLLDEALSNLDRVGEKVKDAKTTYQIGVVFVQMNELERARYPLPADYGDAQTVQQYDEERYGAGPSRSIYGPPGINMDKFDLGQNLVRSIQNWSFAFVAWKWSAVGAEQF